MMIKFSFYKPIYGAIFSMVLLDIEVGMIISWSSPVLPKVSGANYTDDFFGHGLTSDEKTWVTSLMTLGAAFGTVISACITDRIGRKPSTIILAAQSFVGHALMSTVHNVQVFYAARFLAGLTVGGGTTVILTYVGEIASKDNRGTIVSIIGSTLALGFVLCYAIGPYISVLALNVVIFVISLISIVSCFFLLTESPYFHVLKGNKVAAEEVLRKFRPPGDNISTELDEIVNQVKAQYEGSVVHLLKSKVFIKSWLVCLVLLVFQNFTGITAVQFYSQPIMEMIGTNIPPHICSLIVGCLQYLGGFVACFMYDRLRRKTILNISAVAMIIGEVPLGVFCYLQDRGDDVSSIKFLPVICLAVFIFAYNWGWGMIPWVIPGEVFPVRGRMIGMCSVAFCNWIVVFVTTKYMDELLEIGVGPLFWLFAGSVALSIVFVVSCVTETKGKSLEEIQDILNKKERKK